MKGRRHRRQYNYSLLSCAKRNGIFLLILICVGFMGYFQLNKEKVYSIDLIESRSIPDYVPTIPKYFIQTSKHTINVNNTNNSFIRLNPSYKYFHYNDSSADQFVRETMPEHIYQIYHSLPQSVLKADYFRYIVLLVKGGIYSDMDTNCLQPIDRWIEQRFIGKVGLMIGIEADTTLWEVLDGTYARQIQIVQWTIGAAPGHPILHRIVKKIADISPSMARKTLTEKQILEWTGPGIWTDVIAEHLDGKYHFQFNHFKNLKEPKLIGDVYILPITGFSPGLNRMGSKSINDSQAKVQHLFSGSWKNIL